jgi:RNA polymerase sigma factor (sigma-70 family)
MLKQQSDSINPSYRHQQSENLSHVLEPVDCPLPKRGQRGPFNSKNHSQKNTSSRRLQAEPSMVLESAKSKTDSKTNRKSNPATDALSTYLNEALGADLLTKEGEAKLAKSISLHRQAFQRLVLAEPAVIEHLIGLLEETVKKEVRLDTVCNFGLSELAKRKCVEPRLKPTLKFLKRTLKLLRTKHDEVVGSKIERRQLVRETIKRVESLMIRPNHFESAPIENPKALELLGIYQRLSQEMVASNRRLVVQVVRQICGNSPAVLDMIQEGNRGLMHAVTKFDHQCGVRFSTYAMPWIKQAIFGALPNHHRNIRVPENFRTITRRVQRELRQLQRGRFEFRQTDSGQTIALIAESLELSSFDVANHLRMQRDTCSLDQPFIGGGAIGCGSDEQVSRIGDLLTDNRPDPAIGSAKSERDRMVRGMMAQVLTRREHDVIRLRFGFDDGHDRSFAEVGREMGLTRQRVCQVEKRALAKLEKMTSKLCNDN